MKPIIAILALLLAMPALSADRSRAQRDAFKRETPCPANGKARGPCPGWIVDHIAPLCAGGEDHQRNMQWQTVADAKAKDRQEMRQCRAIRKEKP